MLAMFLAMPLTVASAQLCNAQYVPATYENRPPAAATAPMLPSSTANNAFDSQSMAAPGFMAVPSTPAPPSLDAPSLQGHTNGTIGPPGLDTTFISEVEPTPSANNQWIAMIAMALVASLAVLLGRRKKSCVWALGATTAAIMLIAGVAWGTFGLH